VRETLFNWLGQDLRGQRCLDLFAGSGALGLEAVSRGADDVVMVEHDPAAIAALSGHLRALDAGGVRLLREDALAYLRGPCGNFDLIFLDPPFASNLLAACLGEAATRLAPGGKIYIEFGERPDLAAWQVLREGRAGKSHYCLLELA
jgi:16S rRNA (guanine966-N2)-methyltransferase